MDRVRLGHRGRRVRGGVQVWAPTASAYSDGRTILEANPGTWFQIVIALPLAVTALGWMLLHVACRYDRGAAKIAGATLAWLLLAFSVVSGFSIGLFVMPAAVALVIAAIMTPTER
ncbi:MAG TPA: hypothetical protein VF529_03215 [Solirubrobacteraceae bacterium]